MQGGSDINTAVLLLQSAADGKHLARSDGAISINIYTRAAGNRTEPSFQCLWRDTEEVTGNRMQIAGDTNLPQAGISLTQLRNVAEKAPELM